MRIFRIPRTSRAFAIDPGSRIARLRTVRTRMSLDARFVQNRCRIP